MLRLASAAQSAVKVASAAQAGPASAVTLKGLHSQALNRAAEEEMPLRGLVDSLAAPFSPFLDALAQENSRTPAIPKQLAEDTPVWVPSVAKVFPGATRMANSQIARDILIHDPKKAKKPRLSWYNPYDTTWVPSGWFADGLVADMKYYYGDVVAPKQPAKMI